MTSWMAVWVSLCSSFKLSKNIAEDVFKSFSDTDTSFCTAMSLVIRPFPGFFIVSEVVVLIRQRRLRVLRFIVWGVLVTAVPIRNVLSKRVEVLECPWAAINTTSYFKIWPMSMKQLNVFQIVRHIETKRARLILLAQEAFQRHHHCQSAWLSDFVKTG